MKKRKKACKYSLLPTILAFLSFFTCLDMLGIVVGIAKLLGVTTFNICN